MYRKVLTPKTFVCKELANPGLCGHQIADDLVTLTRCSSGWIGWIPSSRQVSRAWLLVPNDHLGRAKAGIQGSESEHRSGLDRAKNVRVVLPDEFMGSHHPRVARLKMAKQSHRGAATEVCHPRDAFAARPTPEGAAVKKQIVAHRTSIVDD